MAKSAKKPRLKPLAKWQKSAVKLGYYTTKEIRQISKLSDLPIEQQTSIRHTWTKKYKQEQSFKAHQKAVETRKRNREERVQREREEIERIEEFERNKPDAFDADGNLNTDRYFVQMNFGEISPVYSVIDKETGEIISQFEPVRKDRWGREYEFAPVNDDGSLSTDRSKFKSQDNLKLNDYDVYTQNPPDSSQVEPNTTEEEPKTVDDFIDDKLDEILDSVIDPNVRQVLRDFIDDIKNAKNDLKFKNEDDAINYDVLDALSDFAEIAVYYDDEDVSAHYEELYRLITGREPDEKGDQIIEKATKNHVDSARPLREEREAVRRQNMANMYYEDRHTNPRTGAPRTLTDTQEQLAKNVVEGILRGEIHYSRKHGTKLIPKK